MPAPDVEYIFDAAVEMCDITADAHFYFMNIRPDTNAWLDAHEGQRTAQICKSIMGDYFDWYQNAPVEEADAATIAGLRASKFQLKQIIENLRYIAIDDVCYRGHTGSRGFRKAQAMSTIKQIANSDSNILNYFDLWKQMMARASTMGRGRFDAGASEYNGLIDRNNDRRRREILERVSIVERRAPKRNHSLRKKRRKVIVKSFNLLADITGQETARAFIGGDAVTIEGRKFDFRCRRAGALHQSGHGCLRVEIVDKIGVVLTDLCVYFDDMPAMDQVAALALHAMVGNEDEILQIGNFLNIRDAGYESPLLETDRPVNEAFRLFRRHHERQHHEWKGPVEAAVKRFLCTRLGMSAAYVLDNIPSHNPGRDFEIAGV